MNKQTKKQANIAQYPSMCEGIHQCKNCFAVVKDTKQHIKIEDCDICQQLNTAGVLQAIQGHMEKIHGTPTTPIPTWKKVQELIINHATQASNYEQKMTAYRAELIEKMEKEKFTMLDNLGDLPKGNQAYNKAIDRCIEMVRGEK